MSGFINPGDTWDQKAEKFVRTFELAAVGIPQGVRNTQTGHKIVVFCKGGFFAAGFDYFIDGQPTTRAKLIALCAGKAWQDA